MDVLEHLVIVDSVAASPYDAYNAYDTFDYDIVVSEMDPCTAVMATLSQPEIIALLFYAYFMFGLIAYCHRRRTRKIPQHRASGTVSIAAAFFLLPVSMTTFVLSTGGLSSADSIGSALFPEGLGVLLMIVGGVMHYREAMKLKCKGCRMKPIYSKFCPDCGVEDRLVVFELIADEKLEKA